MSHAGFAATCIVAYCKERWPEDYIGMTKTVGPDYCHRFEGYSHYGTHKYIQDIEEIEEALGSENGAGIWGFAKYNDGSRLLFTCYQGIAVLDENGLKLAR